jgi:hypothetical protein
VNVEVVEIGGDPLEVAGRQGFELGASLSSKVVMARDFWG